jgi:hypothetical protein
MCAFSEDILNAYLYVLRHNIVLSKQILEE